MTYFLESRQHAQRLGCLEHQRDRLGGIPQSLLRIAHYLPDAQHRRHHACFGSCRLDHMLGDQLGAGIAHGLRVCQLFNVTFLDGRRQRRPRRGGDGGTKIETSRWELPPSAGRHVCP